MPDSHPDQLFVYECRGPKFPQSEPDCEGLVGIWPEPPYYYLFYAHEVLSAVKAWVAARNDWALAGTYRLEYGQWQQVAATPQRVGPFVIGAGIPLPAPAASPDELPLRLSPSVVFGSGLHPTTRGCLAAIAWLSQGASLQSAVDFGTGTGILALACARLGISRVWALDCNALAAKVAQENIRANGLEQQVQLIVARELTVLDATADLLLMNLEWPCLQQVLCGRDWLGYRWVVLSGFLKSQWHQLARWIGTPFAVFWQEILDDWLTVVLGRTDLVAGGLTRPSDHQHPL